MGIKSQVRCLHWHINTSHVLAAFSNGLPCMTYMYLLKGASIVVIIGEVFWLYLLDFM